MLTSFAGSVYPNREFTVGLQPKPAKYLDDLPAPPPLTEDEQWWSRALKVHGYEACLDARGVEDPLGLSSVPISHTRAPKGLNGLSNKGRRSIRVACHLQQELKSRHRIGFGTLTLPELSEEDYVSVHEAWGDIVRTFMQWLDRRLAAEGAPVIRVHVTEIQSERQKKTGRAYFHLHFCYPACRNFNYRWYVSAAEMRLAWERAVSAHCDREYDFAASSDCVVVKRGVAAYLAKYLSKGASAVAAAIKGGLPQGAIGHWWGWSKDARERVRARTCKAASVAEFIWRRLDWLVCNGGIKYVRFVSIQTRLQGERIIGCAGVLTKKGMHMLQLNCPKVRTCYK